MAGYDPGAAEHARARKQTAARKPEPPKPKEAANAPAAHEMCSPAPVQYSQPELDRRHDAIDLLRQISLQGHRLLTDAMAQAIQALAKQDVQPHSEIWSLLSAAANAALLAASGGAASLMVAPLVETAEQAAIGAAVKKAFASAFQLDLAPTAWNADDLIESYQLELEKRLDLALTRLIRNWAATGDALRALPTNALEAFANHAKDSFEPGALRMTAKRHFLVGWTNFLARAMHGAMHWDPWQPARADGPIPLGGARDPWAEPASTRSDPTTANVDPKAMQWALETTQRPMMREHYGILEIFVDATGRLVDIPDYGMRLDNVGPNVRKEIRQMGHVRDLQVNKIVRLCSYNFDGVAVDPPAPIASVLITADGYVRAYNWARFAKVHVEQSATRKPWDIKGDFGRCMDQLIAGRETARCHVDHASENAEIAAFAEHAQGLSLSHLKV